VRRPSRGQCCTPEHMPYGSADRRVDLSEDSTDRTPTDLCGCFKGQRACPRLELINWNLTPKDDVGRHQGASNSAASTASLLSGIPENLIEDVKLSNCYFGHQGMPSTMPPGRGGGAPRPFPDWHTLNVPEIEDAYPELLRFGPTPSNAFFIRHLKNLEMSHVEIAPEGADPRPAFWLEGVNRADFFAVTAPGQQNFALRNVTDLRILWSRAAKDTTLESATDKTI
jgi:hypothetical protein